METHRNNLLSHSIAARLVTPTLPSGIRARKLPVATKAESAATSRSNSSTSSIGRPPVISKLASVKRAVANVANRTVAGTSSIHRSSSISAGGLNKSRLGVSSATAARRNSAATMNVSSLATAASPVLNPRRLIGSIKPVKPSANFATKK